MRTNRSPAWLLVVAAALVPALALGAAMDGLATQLGDAGVAAHTRGDDATAEKKLLQAVKTCGKGGCSPRVRAELLTELGVVQTALGKRNDARDSFVEALRADARVRVAKGLSSPDVEAVFGQAVRKVAGVPEPPPSASVPAVAASAPPSPPPPPPPVETKPTNQVGDAKWVEGVGLVRPAEATVEQPPSRTLVTPPLVDFPSRTLQYLGVGLVTIAPRPDNLPACETSLIQPMFGVSAGTFRPGDRFAFTFVGDAAVGIGSGSSLEHATCPIVGTQVAIGSIVVPSFSALFHFDFHPPGRYANPLALGLFAGPRFSLWTMSLKDPASGAPLLDGASPAPDLGAEYGAHLGYYVGSLASWSAFVDASYRLRWSVTRRGDYARIDIGGQSSAVSLAFRYETLLRAVGGDVTDTSATALFARNVPVERTLALIFGFRL